MCGTELDPTKPQYVAPSNMGDDFGNEDETPLYYVVCKPTCDGEG